MTDTRVFERFRGSKATLMAQILDVQATTMDSNVDEAQLWLPADELVTWTLDVTEQLCMFR